MIILPSSGPPQRTPVLDRAHPLARGLIFFVPGGAYRHDIAGGRAPTPTGAPSVRGSAYGPLDVYGASTYLDYPVLTSAELDASTPMTVAWTQLPLSGGFSGQAQFLVGTRSFLLYADSTAADYAFGAGWRGGGVSMCFGGVGLLTLNRLDRMLIRAAAGVQSATTSNWTAFRGSDKFAVTNSPGLSADSASLLRLGARNGGADPWRGGLGAFAIWSRALSDDEAIAWNSDPWQVLLRPRRLWAMGVGGAADITGASSIGLDALSASAAGTVASAGAGASTLDGLTPTAAGAVAVAAAASSTLGALTCAAAGSVVSGRTGTGAVTLGALSAAAAASVATAGASSIALGGLTPAASGTVAIGAAASATIAALGASATGIVVSGLTGASSVTLAALSAAAAGTVATAGAGAATLGAIAPAASAAVGVQGSAACGLGALGATAAGVLGSTIVGSSAITLGQLGIAAAGLVAVAGSSARTLAALGSAASGTLGAAGQITGAAAVTLGALAFASAGFQGDIASAFTTYVIKARPRALTLRAPARKLEIGR